MELANLQHNSDDVEGSEVINLHRSSGPCILVSQLGNFEFFYY